MRDKQSKTNEQMLEELLLKNRKQWFVTMLKLRGLYTKQLELAYETYVKGILQDEPRELLETASEFDFGAELKNLIDYLLWYDENIAVNDDERFINKEGL